MGSDPLWYKDAVFYEVHVNNLSRFAQPAELFGETRFPLIGERP